MSFIIIILLCHCEPQRWLILLITLTCSQPSKYYVKRAICNKKAHNTFMQGNQLTALQKSLYYSNHYRTIRTDNSFLSGQVNYTQYMNKLSRQHSAFPFERYAIWKVSTIIAMKPIINRCKILQQYGKMIIVEELQKLSDTFNYKIFH